MRLSQEGEGGTNEVLVDESRSISNREGDAVSLEGSTRSYLIRRDGCSKVTSMSAQRRGGSEPSFASEVVFRGALDLLNLFKKDGGFPMADVTFEYTANALVNDFKRWKPLAGSTVDEGRSGPR